MRQMSSPKALAFPLEPMSPPKLQFISKISSKYWQGSKLELKFCHTFAQENRRIVVHLSTLSKENFFSSFPKKTFFTPYSDQTETILNEWKVAKHLVMILWLALLQKIPWSKLWAGQSVWSMDRYFNENRIFRKASALCNFFDIFNNHHLDPLCWNKMDLEGFLLGFLIILQSRYSNLASLISSNTLILWN